MSANRRDLLMLIGAGMVAGGLATPGLATGDSPDAALRRSLDGLAALPSPAARLQALAGIATAPLSPSARIDLLTVRQGLQDDAALAALPGDAPARYPLLLARACGAAIPVAEAAARLQAWADPLQARAAALFAQLGVAGSTGEGFCTLFADPRWHDADDDAGRAAAVADMTRWLDRARGALPRWFAPLPPACLDVTVATLSPADLAAGKPGYRVLPAPGRPGTYVVDLRDIARRPRWSLRSVVHHELLPGHMIQLPIEQIAAPHPLRLHYAKAFTEGWAIYAEQLAWRGGLFDSAVEELGALHWLLFRATRGLADIGLNHRGWSTAQTLAYLGATIGAPAYFAPFAADLTTIAAQPGSRAAEALIACALADAAPPGPAIRAYHQRVLANGALPLSLIAD